MHPANNYGVGPGGQPAEEAATREERAGHAVCNCKHYGATLEL